MFLSWFSFISPDIPSVILQRLQVLAVVMVVCGVGVVPALRRSVDRWTLEWLKNIRSSLIWYGLALLVLTLLSKSNVSVLGARAWYGVLLAAVVLRIWRLYGRRQYWGERRREEEQRIQKLKYMPGR